jgi:hypothetical protein
MTSLIGLFGYCWADAAPDMPIKAMDKTRLAARNNFFIKTPVYKD